MSSSPIKSLDSSDSRNSRRKRNALRGTFGKSRQKPEEISGSKNEQSMQRNSVKYTSLIPGYESCITSSIPLTKGHFMDAYSKGKWNLSNVPRPEFITNHGLMMPPESYNEPLRLKTTRQYVNSPHWEDSKRFTKILNKALRLCSVFGVSISLMEESQQLIKYCHSLSVKEWPRRISIDGHTILSSQYFTILDASKDWRFINNPLVKNYPKIRLYAGVPLVASNKQVIGALSIFDGLPRHEFYSRHIQELQLLAKEIMEILESPVVESTDKNITDDTNLLKQIGRATISSGSKSFTVPVYEKDGSGTPYSQNHNFRFSKHDLTKEDAINLEIWKTLTGLGAGNFKASARELCSFIAERLNLSLVFIVEVRVAEVYKIDQEYFPKGNEIEAENFKFANKLERLEKEHIITRVIDSYPSNISEELSDSALYYRALSSEFGIFIKSKVKTARNKHGICMSFYRVPSKLVRKKKLSKHQQPRPKPIDLYLKSGGYIIGAFSEEREITHDDINYILNGANIYRKMFIGNMQ